MRYLYPRALWASLSVAHKSLAWRIVDDGRRDALAHSTHGHYTENLESGASGLGGVDVHRLTLAET